MNDQRKTDDEGQEPDWVDRHLTKVLIAGAVICTLGLIGRALTG